MLFLMQNSSSSGSSGSSSRPSKGKETSIELAKEWKRNLQVTMNSIYVTSYLPVHQFAFFYYQLSLFCMFTKRKKSGILIEIFLILKDKKKKQ